MLALLVLHANEVVPVERLIDEVWGESPPESAANLVQGYVSHLRKVLEPGRGRGEHELLVSRAPGYVLLVQPERLDAERFTRLAGEGRRLLEAGDATAAAERLREALAIWRGPALADLAYEPFARRDVERLEDLRLAALEDRIDADLALGRQAALVGEVTELVARHPLRERLRGQLMVALYRCGRQSDALETYREGRAVLHEELGVEPGPALRELEREILRHDPALGAPETTPLAARPRRRRLVLLVAAGVVAGVAAALVLMRGGSEAPPPVHVAPHSVVVVDPSRNAVVADIPVGGYPGPVAADTRFVYVCNIGDATISQIDPVERTVVGTFGLSRAIDLLAGAGHIWAANGGVPGHTPIPPGTVSDFALGTAATRTLRVGPNRTGDEQQTTLAANRDGFPVWVGNADSATVREIDPSLDRTLQTVEGVSPGGLAVVGTTSTTDTVWASEPARNRVVRIDGRSGRVVRRIPLPGGPTRLAADARTVWVITARRRLYRIDARTNRPVAAIPLPIVPRRVALGAGSVWVSGFRSRDAQGRTKGGALVRVDPAANRIVATIPVGDLAVDGIAVSRGLVWAAVPPS